MFHQLPGETQPKTQARGFFSIEFTGLHEGLKDAVVVRGFYAGPLIQDLYGHPVPTSQVTFLAGPEEDPVPGSTELQGV